MSDLPANSESKPLRTGVEKIVNNAGVKTATREREYFARYYY